MGRLNDKYQRAQKLGDLAWDDHQALSNAYDVKHDRELSVRRINLLRQTLDAWLATLLKIRSLAEDAK